MGNLPWWAVLLAGILLGWVLEWLLELFYFRRGRMAEAQRLTTEYQTRLTAKDEAFSLVRQDLDSQLSAAQTDLAAAAEARSALEAQLQAKDNDIAALNARLATLQSDLDKVRKDNSSLLDEIVTFAAGATTATVAGKLRNRDDAQAVLQALRADLDAAHANNAKLETVVRDLQEELSGVRSQLNDAQAELEAIEHDRSGKAAEVAALTAGAATAAALIQSKTDEADAASRRAAELEAQLTQRDKAISDADRQRASVQEALDRANRDLASLRKDYDKLKEENGVNLGKIAALTAAAATVTAIKSKADEAEAAKARIAELEAQVRAKDSEIAALNDRLAELQIAAKRLADVGNAQPSGVGIATIAAGATLAQALAGEASTDDGDDRTTLGVITGEPTSRGIVGSMGVAVTESPCPQNLSDIAGIGTIYEQRLYDAGIGSFWQVAQLDDDTLMRVLAIDATSNFTVDLQAIRDAALQLAKETHSEGRVWSGGDVDDFEPLEGIGAVYESRLYDAGICTYEALARLTVERLAEVCQAPRHAVPNYSAWIAQAGQLAQKKQRFGLAASGVARLAFTVCPQDLQDIDGIGSLFEQRLYDAGIGTFWEVAQMSNADLQRILQISERQLLTVDFDAIRASARRLAQETGSEGRVWSGGKADDFEPLEGIGRVFERRLYEAGICTFEALADATVEQLAAICSTPDSKFSAPDYSKWIAQAKRALKKRRK